MKKLSEFKWIRVTAMVLSVLQVASPVWSSDRIQMINNQPVAVVAADQEVPKLEAATQVSLVDAFEAGALSQPTPTPDSWIRTASNSDYFYGVEKNERGTSRLVLYKKSGSGFQSEVLIDSLGDNAKDTLVDVSPDGSTVVYGYRRSKSVYFNGIPRFGHWEETIVVKSLRPASEPMRQKNFTETDGDSSHYDESPIQSIQFEGETAKIVSSSGKIRYFDFKTFKEVSTFVPQGWTQSLTNSNFAYKITSTDQTNPMQGNQILVVRDLTTDIEIEIYNKPVSQEDIWDKPDVSADGKQVVLTTRAVGGTFKVYVKDLTTTSAAAEFVVSTDGSVSKAPNAIQITDEEIRLEIVSGDMSVNKGIYVIDRLSMRGELRTVNVLPEGYVVAQGNPNFIWIRELIYVPHYSWTGRGIVQDGLIPQHRLKIRETFVDGTYIERHTLSFSGDLNFTNVTVSKDGKYLAFSGVGTQIYQIDGARINLVIDMPWISQSLAMDQSNYIVLSQTYRKWQDSTASYVDLSRKTRFNLDDMAAASSKALNYYGYASWQNQSSKMNDFEEVSVGVLKLKVSRGSGVYDEIIFQKINNQSPSLLITTVNTYNRFDDLVSVRSFKGSLLVSLVKTTYSYSDSSTFPKTIIKTKLQTEETIYDALGKITDLKRQVFNSVGNVVLSEEIRYVESVLAQKVVLTYGVDGVLTQKSQHVYYTNGKLQSFDDYRFSNGVLKTNYRYEYQKNGSISRYSVFTIYANGKVANASILNYVTRTKCLYYYTPNGVLSFAKCSAS